MNTDNDVRKTKSSTSAGYIVNFGNNGIPNSFNVTPNYNQGGEINAYKGFVRGNLFDNLYDPYRNFQSLPITPMSERELALAKVQQYAFAMIDLNLYLDVNPNDTEAIKLFNNYRMLHDQATKEFESAYGPLMINSDATNMSPWVWINGPWPWEVQR